jgi:hypothetical protein
MYILTLSHFASSLSPFFFALNSPCTCLYI